MLNRQSSSSKKYALAPAPAQPPANELRKKEKKSKKKKKQSPPRSPLLDLNNGSLSRNNSTSSSISSSMSVDASKGCLRFFLLNSNSSSSSKPSPLPSFLTRHKNLSKISLRHQNDSNPTPSSRSTLACTNENRHLVKTSSQKRRNNPSISLKPNISTDLTQQERFSEPIEQNHHRPVTDNLTPVGKLVCGFGVDCVIDQNNSMAAKQNSATSTKTPPVQVSVSPEMQCESASVHISNTTKPNFTCYGAGHVVSGVIDRRKCRPRGILTVGGSNGIDSSALDSSATASIDNDNSSSRRRTLIPLPAEASVSWFSSPCHENDEDRNTVVDPATIDYKKFSTSSTTCSSSCRKTSRITLLSPRMPPEFKELAGLSFDEVVGRSTPKVVSRTEEDREDSSISIEYLGSGNVIQTPNSDDSLSSERRRRSEQPWYKCRFDDSGGSSANVVGKTRWDPLGLSFKFANLNRSSRTCSSNSSSPMENVRISWREGLASRICEMDELDCCCRCSFDDEKDDDGLILHESLEDKLEVDEEDKGKRTTLLSEKSSTCAECICTDGGDLVASTDSDWTVCYKNQLFQL